MRTPPTLGALAAWARDQDLGALLDQPCDDVLLDLDLSPEDEKALLALCQRLRARTLFQALGDRSADLMLARLTSPLRAADVRERLFAALRRLDDSEDGEQGDFEQGLEEHGEPSFPGTQVPPSWRVPAANERQPPAPPAPPVLPPVPQKLDEVRLWAAEHGVSERLADPIAVLGPLVYATESYRSPGHSSGALTVADAFVPLPTPKAARREARWQEMQRQHAADLVMTSARQYLTSVAATRATVLARRRALEARARPPSDPNLQALLGRLEGARAELAPLVQARPIGTYLPQPGHLEQDPLRVVYGEGEKPRLGQYPVQAAVLLERDPLRAACTCPASRSGPCTHLLDALDAAIDIVRDPDGEAPRLAAVLAVPGWQRFLHAFGAELSRRESPAPPEDIRVAWRVAGGGGVVTVEPLLQKRLKGGGWSQGGRVGLDDVAARRGLLADPRDARVFRALTMGDDDDASYLRPSRLQALSILETLVGHPRVFLEGKGAAPARVARERLRVALDAAPEGVRVSFFVGAVQREAGELLALTGGDGHLVDVDPSAGTVTICALDERALALLAAFERQPARFPPESYDDLLRGLTPLQASVDLTLPEALVGEPVEGDPRPVVRLSPRESGEVDVEILVRPVEGGPAFRPGEGPVSVLHARQGRRVNARRDLAREASAAAAVAGHLGPGRLGEAGDPSAPGASAWTSLLDEEATLDLLAALRDLGEAVVVEWPEPDKRLSLTAMVSRKELRIRVTDRRDWFGVEGEVEVDGDTIPLSALLEAVRRGRRYVRVAEGRFAAIEDDLRRRASAADDVLHSGKKGLEVALPGVALIEELVGAAGHLDAASRWRELVTRLDAARTLDPALPAGLTATLRPYQAEGFRWLMRLAAWGAGACLADDMGLGKTVQALALLLSRAEGGPALVIAPTSVGPNWIREAERFAPGLRARLYRGPARAALLAEAAPGDLLVTSYALALRDAEALGQTRFATLVLDEAQAIKNAMTRRARAIAGLDAELRVALTGTPVENHLGELWSLMRVLTPGLLGSWDHFRDRFAGPIERDHDPARSAALSRLVRPFLLRRTKVEVAPELPPRTEIERFVDLSPAERRLYDDARRAALESIATGGGDVRFVILAALMRLRRLACHPRLQDDGSTVPSSKLATLLEIVGELREEGHRALVFSQFTTHLALVREALDAAGITYQYLDGSTPSEERTRRIDAFQSGHADLFLISLKAGGTGLNLTAADYVIHLDPWWNPAVEDQATDRAHRIGQTKPVTVIRLIARGTIEEAVLSLHRDKRALAASVFDEEGSPARLSPEELASLIRAGADETAREGAEDEGDSPGDEVVAGAAPESRPPKGPKALAAALAPRPAKGTKVVAAPALAPRPLKLPPVAALLPVVSALPPPAPRPPPAPTRVSAAASAPPSPPPAAVPEAQPAAAPVSARSLVARVIDFLAEQRGGVDPRYDPTLRTYERSLRRFTAYLAANGSTAEPTEAAIDGYLTALNEGRWPVPASERGIARTVMNHLRVFLRKQQPGSAAPAAAGRGVDDRAP